MAVAVTGYAVENWLITPAALAKTDLPPKTSYDQQFLFTLSGVALCNCIGADDWLRDFAFIGPNLQNILAWAASKYFIPVAAPPYSFAFQVDQYATHATMNSIFDKDQSVNAGFAVDSWYPDFYSEVDVITGAQVDRLYNGLVVNLAVRDVDAHLYRVGFTVTLLGWLRLVMPPS
jgi:hypothetical protein